MDYFAPLKEALEKRTDINISEVQNAFEFAQKAHHGQMRKSGEEYITHPVAVAVSVSQIGGDQESIIAALLHDTLEDTSASEEDIKKNFGENVSMLVEGMTKVSKGKFKEASSLDEKIESLRKLFSIMSGDIRVIVIKILDRLHNMETLSSVSEEKQKRIAKETLDIYAKIADKLGIEPIKIKLENLAFRYLNPKEYQRINEIKKNYKNSEQEAFNSIKTIIKNVYNDIDIKRGELSFIFLQKENIHKKNIPSPIAISVISPSIQGCYEILGIIRSTFTTNNHTIYDYLHCSKQNGYRGIEMTALFNNHSLYISICTAEMEKENLNGVLNFCFKKERSKTFNYWVTHLNQLVKNAPQNSKIFFEQLQNDILNESIIVFSEKEGSFFIPPQSTALDAAYHIHKDKAQNIKKIFINGKELPLYSVLNDSDSLYFEIGNTSEIKYNWLKYCDTSFARGIIKSQLQNQEKDRKISIGKEILDIEIKKHGLGVIDEIETDKITNLCLELDVHSFEDLLIQIGEASISPKVVIEKMLSHRKNNHDNKKIIQKIEWEVPGENFLDFWEKTKDFVKKYSITKQNNSEKLQIKSELLISNKEKEKLNNILKRLPQIKNISLNNGVWGLKKSIMILLFLNILWGVGLVVADYMIEYQSLSPFLFATSRLWTFAILMGLIFLLSNKSTINLNKPLPKKNWSFILSTLFFTGIPIFTYLALYYASPSEYVSLMLTNSLLILIPQILNKKDLWIKISMITSLIIGYFFLIVQNTSFQGVAIVYTVLSTISFGGYSYTSGVYIKKYSIHARYSKFLAIISIIGAILSTIVYLIFIQKTPPFIDVLYSIIYAMCFSTIAYSIYYRFLEKSKYASLGPDSFIIFLITTFISQRIFLSEPIYINEWIALPFLLIAVITGSYYKEKLTKYLN